MRRSFIVLLLAVGTACRHPGTPDGTVLVDWRDASLPAIPDHELHAFDAEVDYEPHGGGKLTFAVHAASDRLMEHPNSGFGRTGEAPLIVKLTLLRGAGARLVSAACDTPARVSKSFDLSVQCRVTLVNDTRNPDGLQIRIDARDGVVAHAGLANASVRTLLH